MTEENSNPMDTDRMDDGASTLQQNLSQNPSSWVTTIPLCSPHLIHTSSIYESEIIEIQAGTRLFRVHKGRLTGRFFQNALKPEWADNRKGTPIDLQAKDPDAVQHYIE